MRNASCMFHPILAISGRSSEPPCQASNHTSWPLRLYSIANEKNMDHWLLTGWLAMPLSSDALLADALGGCANTVTPPQIDSSAPLPPGQLKPAVQITPNNEAPQCWDSVDAQCKGDTDLLMSFDTLAGVCLLNLTDIIVLCDQVQWAASVIQRHCRGWAVRSDIAGQQQAAVRIQVVPLCALSHTTCLTCCLA